MQLTGGPDSDPAPEGRNTYAWVMESDRADLFLTYCTNAVLAGARCRTCRSCRFRRHCRSARITG